MSNKRKRNPKFPVPGQKRKKPWYRHGNWVGPGWSAGEAQDSVIDPSVEAVDEFDQTAKDHDQTYAWINENIKDSKQKSKALENADRKFTIANTTGRKKGGFLEGFEREAAASAVNIQRLWRDFTNKDPEKEASVPDSFETPAKGNLDNTFNLGISPNPNSKKRRKKISKSLYN